MLGEIGACSRLDSHVQSFAHAKYDNARMRQAIFRVKGSRLGQTLQRP